MTIYDKIIQSLENSNVAFERLEHEPVKTSQEASKIRGSSIEEGAKALIFKADNKPVLIVVSGDRKVEVAKFKLLYKIKNLKFISPFEVKELTGLEVGSIPPFGPVLKLPMYCDSSIFANVTMVFNAGSLTKSIRMKTEDFDKVVNPVKGEFSAKL
ncbi:MAG TPA: YbaK/EbsC family protein [Patescibacteria group bacterium]